MEVNFRLNLVSSWPRWITTASEVENELSSSALALLSFKILTTTTSAPSAFLSAGPSNEILSSGKPLARPPHPSSPPPLFFICDALTKWAQWQKKKNLTSLKHRFSATGKIAKAERLGLKALKMKTLCFSCCWAILTKKCSNPIGRERYALPRFSS